MATGDTLAVFTPQHNEPPASGEAKLDLRNEQPVLDFAAAAGEAAIFSGVLPAHYAGGGLTVEIAWAATSATSGGVDWSAAFERHAEDDADLDADNFGAAATGSDNAPSSSGMLRYTQLAIDSGDMDNAQAGEHFRLKVSRGAGDSLAGDAELVSVELREA